MRAFVEIIRDAVTVRVERAAIRTDGDTGWCRRTLVECIGDAVTVGIRTRATVDGDLSALRCAGALVQVVGHAVTIGIERATACIHLYASRGFRPLVEIIGNAVAVHSPEARRVGK